MSAIALGSGVRGQEAISSYARRPSTVEDAIRMTIPGDRSYVAGGYAVHLAQYSPDGRKFVMVLRKGDLEHGTNQFSLMLWDTGTLFGSSAPDVLLTMASSSNRDAIESVKWLDDNETIFFLGEGVGEKHQLFRLDVRTRDLNRVTASPTNVVSYSLSAKAETIAFLAEPSVESMWNETTRHQGILVSPEQALSDLVRGIKREAHYTLSVVRRGATTELKTLGTIPAPRPNSAYVGLSLSPDGKYVAVLTNVERPPQWWSGYKGNWSCGVSAGRDLPPGVHNPQMVGRYELVNTVNGKSQVLLDAPSVCGFAIAEWSPNSRAVIIANTYLPLASDPNDSEREEKQRTLFAVHIEIPTRQLTKFSTVDQNALVMSVDWQGETEVTLKHVSPAGLLERHYQKLDEIWRKVDKVNRGIPLPKISLEEDINRPPQLVAEDPLNHARVTLLDLNPQFKELQFGEVKEIQFKDKAGYKRAGGLYYPVHYQVGRRYPLVIQTHGWFPELRRFRMNGFSSTANAAQALAGKDIMVLQLDDYNPTTSGTSKDLLQASIAYESAVEYLGGMGLVDPKRVGIIGFSYTCNTVEYFLTNSKVHIAAASITEGTSDSYFAYLLFASTLYPLAAQAEQEIGAMPFGSGLEVWRHNSPGFNVDRIRTPLLITALSPKSVLTEWEYFAALRRLGKPVEMISLEDGSHDLQKPWDRRISQQGNVDWFCFWLTGEEDPDPAKADQYTRWRELRTLQKKNEATRTPKQ